MSYRLRVGRNCWFNALAIVGLGPALISSQPVVAVPQPPTVAQQPTNRGSVSVTGELSTDSAVLEDYGSYYETHTFSGVAGEIITIDLSTNDFEPYLRILSPSGELVGESSGAAQGQSSQDFLYLPIDGAYTLIVTSYRVHETGTYQLEWRSADDAEIPIGHASQLGQQAIVLFQENQLDNAVPLIEEIVAIFQDSLGSQHSITATGLSNLAELYRLQGRYDEAEQLFQRALAIRAEVLDANHPLTAQSLNSLGFVYMSQGRFEEVESLFRQGLMIREQALGLYHPLTADNLNNLAYLKMSQGHYEEAEPLFQQALEIHEKSSGPGSPATAITLKNLATLYYYQARYEEAEQMHQRALRILEEAFGRNHPLTAQSLNELAIIYQSQGHYEEAELHFQQALEIHEATLGAQHPETATTLNNLAMSYQSQGRYLEAEAYHKRALAVREESLGDNHPDIAQSLNNLALLYESQGLYMDAETHYQRALEIRRESLGENHPLTAQSYNNLATIYQSQGRYADTEPLYRSALTIREQSLGPDHPDVAQSLNNLALLFRIQGRYSEVEPLYQRALEINQEALGLEHPITANSLNNLGGLYYFLEHYEEVEPLYQRALAIREQALGRDHPDTAQSLNNLAFLYESQGRYVDAETHFQQALIVYEQAFGSDHPDTAAVLNNLAELYRIEHRYIEAERLHQRALKIKEEALGLNHPDTANSLINLALLYYVQGQWQSTLTYLSQGLAVQEKVLSLNLVGGSDAGKRDYLNTALGSAQLAVNLHLHGMDTDEVAQLALNTVLQRKGRVLDLFTNLREQLADDPEALVLLNELSASNTQLANLAFDNDNQEALEFYQTQVPILQERIRDLEDQLSRRSTDFAALTASPSVLEIQASLPASSALVEIVRYLPINPESSFQEPYGAPRYAAYVLKPDGTIQGMDLGAAEEIDHLVATLSTSLSSANTPLGQVKQAARELDALVMAPVREALGDTTTVFISPDGALNLIPFEALMDESDRYLVETYQFRYLTSGRDLMRLEGATEVSNPAVLVGNPTYGRPGERVAQADTRTIDVANGVFPALPGTQVEVDLIAPKLNDAQVYTQTNATEAVIREQNNPSILHIAAHGFFQPTQDALNPLLQSGLILAGAAAGRQSGPDQDGILTALEVTGMNLQGTQLVVLSACETGLGELAVGEGIYGLRRAFVLAGSQTQVISLWKVSDTATQELMVDYYDRLLAGTARDAALRETQLAFLDSDEYSHPYYWAAFIGSGDWRPLQPN